jgi:Ca2+-binding RTX toxin-like protein
MATYDFSTLIATGNKTQAFTTLDFLTFNDGIRASDLIIGLVGADATLKLATGFTLTLSNFVPNKISSTNFTFADGSKLIIGDGKISITDGTSNDTLIGTDGGDYLDGVGGNDTVSYATASSAVTVDLALTAAQDTIGAGVDKLANIDNIIGSVFNDTLYGDGNANVLNGGGNADIMDGKNGSDTYVATAGDIITDSGTTGTDVVNAGVDFVLGSGIENLVLTGTLAINGRGNSLNNSLTGNSGNNILDGGTGDDTFVGSNGLDTYFVDSANDSITETSPGGIDQVNSTATSFDMSAKAGFVENMRLFSGAITGIGNILANKIFGNGNANTLDGGDGNDTLTDLLGGDDILKGGAGADLIIGGGGADKLIGGTSETASDSSADNLFGGSGNDSYYVTDTSDIVNELANNGIDLIQTTISYVLNDVKGIGIENLTLLPGSSTLNGTGNSLANTITGNDGANVLIGGKGADTLIGGIGSDSLTGGVDAVASDAAIDILNGGTGNDIYYVTDTSDRVIDAVNAPDTNDLVNTNVSYALNDTDSAGVEKLTLTGSGNITGTGNSIANTITGNSGNNTLNGGGGVLIVDTLIDTLGGNDILDGGTGADIMSGGIGDDTYVVDNASDTVNEASLSGADLVQASVTYSIDYDVDIEKLTLTGGSIIDGTGNSSANTIIGNNVANKLIGGDGADYLQGGTGTDTLIGGSRDTGSIASDGTPDADTMDGGTGNDTYWVDFETDTVVEDLGTTNGIDLVVSRVTYTLTDTDVENLTLTGLTGLVTNTATINGTGNNSANALTGNDGNNTLSGMAGIDTLAGNAGDDILDGGIGADVMTGGTGKDTYIVETMNTAVGNGDQITETGTDIDLVQAYASYTIFDTNVENLTLMGTSGINGTGNNSANILNGNSANNTLTGQGGNDTLDGKEGLDILKGELGQDTYYVDAAGDVVDETGGDATIATTASATLDTVLSAVSFAITDTKVENLSLLGTDTINATGNSSANIISGNAGNNTLDAKEGNDIVNGGAGKDSLTGGAGVDKYVFTLATDSSLVNFDVITDYKTGGAELIDLSAIDTGTLAFGGVKTATPTTVSAAHTIDYYLSGTNTFIIADTDGNATTIDFKIQLTGFVTALVAADFVR